MLHNRLSPHEHFFGFTQNKLPSIFFICFTFDEEQQLNARGVRSL